MMDNHKKIALLTLAVLAVALLVGCGGGPTSQPEAPAANPNAVIPLTGPELTGNMGIQAADGSTPCGVFNVNGFGQKRAVLADYPECTASNYTVMCLNDKAEWNADNVSDVFMSTDKLRVGFTSQQEGVCGLFAAP